MGNGFYREFDHETYDRARKTDNRSVFQIDRDRIAFSYPFRRLQSKTQVFQTGEFDFYRTRLTHSIEVARVGRSICENLNRETDFLSPTYYIDPDLVEAICLAHDIGHPPFGHIGERKLNELMKDHGGFEGNAQTLRIIWNLIFEGKHSSSGMQPSRAFTDGILKYKRTFAERHGEDGTPPENHFVYNDQKEILQWVHDTAESFPEDKSLECQIMDWADDTAYSLHDIVDGIKAGFLTPHRLEQWGEKAAGELTPYQLELLHELVRITRKGNPDPAFASKVGTFIRAVQLKERNGDSHPLRDKTNRYRYKVIVDSAIKEECCLYKKVAFELIFESAPIQLLEYKSGYLLEKLFNGIISNYSLPHPLGIFPERTHLEILKEEDFSSRMRKICDYISALTDPMAQRLYQRMFSPDFGSIIDRDL